MIPGYPTSTPAYAWARPLSNLLESDPNRIVGHLTQHSASRSLWAATDNKQVVAWRESVEWLQVSASALVESMPAAQAWALCLEYAIPRRGGRIDALLIADDLLFVIEFKATQADAASRRQAEDYALELLDFHAESHHLPVFPIVCAGKATHSLGSLESRNGVATTSTCPPDRLATTCSEIHARHHDPERIQIEPHRWLAAPYHPTPTIIEAARCLYAGHEVRELAQSEAGALHLRRTQLAVEEVVATARKNKNKAICFITGIPGAGKTLAGLNAVHGLGDEHDATFLSGNGPLVKVLQAVLAQDIARREGINQGEAHRRSTTLVTNVHKWLEEYVDRRTEEDPHEDVVIFDEAQRAWSREHSMRKFKRDASEPEMLLNVMSRRESAVIVGLVGSGQEINTGEAGLAEWGRALAGRFKDWEIVVSPEMTAGTTSVGTKLFESQADVPHDRLRMHKHLHLAVPQRSFRAQRLSDWVEHVLAGEPNEASLVMEELHSYPIVMTRCLERARQWTRERARGLRRSGLLASSGARRLRQDGITVREPVDEVKWFLTEPDDIRSSSFLELAMTEFGVQGLEVDWACLAWGGDLTRDGESWRIRSLRGPKWTEVRKEEDQKYAINRYRVLLTRAREGMVIWVPAGSPEDPTRDPSTYESVAKYLGRCGVKTV